MRRKERIHRARIRLAFIQQNPKHLGHTVWIDAGFDARLYALFKTTTHLLRLLHLLHRVTPSHVSDLVAEYTSEFIHRLSACNEATVDVHPAPRHRRRVHPLAVHDSKVPDQTTGIRERSKRPAERPD